jgi:hypothetical protein
MSLSQTSYTYSNSECKPTVTLKDGSTTIPSSGYTVSYSNNTNVGTATATATDKSGGNYSFSPAVSGTFTIVCKPCVAPTAKTGLVYNGSAQALANQGATYYGTMVYSSDGSSWGTSILSGTNAGDYIVNWKVTGNTNVCCTGISNFWCTIAKYTPTAPKATTYSWNGSGRALVSGGSTSFGTMVYSTTSGGTYSTTIPTQTAAGNYTVWWKVTGNTNVNNTSPSSISCKILQKSGCTISFATTSVSKTYGDSTFTNAITNSGNGSLTWGTSSSSVATVNSSGQVTIVGAGSCTISATTTSTTNCMYSTTAASYTLSVAKKTISIPTPTGVNRTYNGSAATATFPAATGAGITKYRYSINNSTWTETTSNPS